MEAINHACDQVPTLMAIAVVIVIAVVMFLLALADLGKGR
jgi:hypothetical protein